MENISQARAGGSEPLLPECLSGLSLWCEVELDGRQVLVREDLNVPLSDSGAISDDSRLQAALPGLQQIVAEGAAVRVVSHLGRPVPGEIQAGLSMLPVAQWFSDKLGQQVPLLDGNWLGAAAQPPGSLAICENIRFIAGETNNDDSLAEELAGLCDIYINDAFAVSHRCHASVHGITKYASQSCLGPLMYQEIKNLAQVMEQPQRPLVAIVGGAKLESKMGVLQTLIEQVDTLVVGGGIANALLAAKGHRVGQSLTNADARTTQMAQSLLDSQYSSRLFLPCDVVCADKISTDANKHVCGLDDIPDNGIILDVGPQSREKLATIIGAAGAIIWSGPIGLFEIPCFAAGTKCVVDAVAASGSFSVAGGGDTLAAISILGDKNKFSYLSTGGSAFLSFLETGSLPALDAMRAHTKLGSRLSRIEASLET